MTDDDSGNSMKVAMKYIEFVFPRNTFAPILMAFALENIVSESMKWYFQEVGAVVGWSIILVVAFIVSTVWGLIIGDKEKLEEEIEEVRE